MASRGYVVRRKLTAKASLGDDSKVLCLDWNVVSYVKTQQTLLLKTMSFTVCKSSLNRGLPCGPVFRSLRFHCRRLWLNTWLGD